MASRVYRDRLIAAIRGAWDEHEAAKGVTHGGVKGRAREIIAANRILRPLLPWSVGLGTGLIVDHVGGQSAETDLVLYDRALLPGSMYDDSFGLFPLDACLAVIEVKSTLSRHKLEEAISNARKLTELQYAEVGPTIIGGGNPQAAKLELGGAQPSPALRLLFAFETDLGGNGSKSEIDRYHECDANSKSDPALRMICVQRRGCWYFSANEWHHVAPTADHDEVIYCVLLLLNSLAGISRSRGLPRIGQYLVMPHS